MTSAMSMLLWCSIFEENMALCFQQLLGKKGDFYEEQEGLRYRSGLSFPAYNGILYRNDRVEERGFLEQEVRSFQALRLPFVLSVSSAYQLPSSVLRSFGLFRAGRASAMVCGLETQHTPPSLDDWNIERVTDEVSLLEWVRVQCQGFGFPKWLEKETFSFLKEAPLEGDTALYLGRWRGEPVATSMGVRSDDVIGVYNVSTLPKARRRGFGRAMTAHVLREGLEGGAKTGILQATAEGEILYRKMGFVPVGTFEHYLWAPFGQLWNFFWHGVFRSMVVSWQRLWG